MVRRYEMNMPGFTAEASIYKSTTVYPTKSVGASGPGSALITPQQLPLDIWQSVRISDEFIALRRLRRQLECGFQYQTCRQGCGGLSTLNSLDV